MKLKLPKIPKPQTSKLIIFIMIGLSVIITGVGIYAAFAYESVEILVALCTAVFVELGCATTVYYMKAKEENKVKIILGAIKEINKLDDLTDEETRIIEALVSSIDS